jgi:hypothetical protein
MFETNGNIPNKQGVSLMDDIIYLMKVSSNSLIVFFIFELIIYNLVNWDDNLKGLKKSKNIVPPLRFFRLLFITILVFSEVLIIGYIYSIRSIYFENPWNSIFTEFSIVLFLLFITLYLLFIPILIDLIRIAKYRLKLQYTTILTGLSIIFFGILIYLLQIWDLIPIMKSIYLESFIIVGIIILSYGLLSISSLNESIASLVVDEYYLVQLDGNIILSHSFHLQAIDSEQGSPITEDDQLFASSIVGIDGLLREISSSKGILKTLVFQDKILIVEKSDNFLSIIVTTYELEKLRKHLIENLNLIEIFNTNNNQNSIINENQKLELIRNVRRWYREDLKKFSFLSRKLVFPDRKDTSIF